MVSFPARAMTYPLAIVSALVAASRQLSAEAGSGVGGGPVGDGAGQRAGGQRSANVADVAHCDTGIAGIVVAHTRGRFQARSKEARVTFTTSTARKAT